MSDAQEYRQKYDDPRVDESYRLYVDGKLPLRQLAPLAGVSTRTLIRYSTRDSWTEEQTARTKYAANGTAVVIASPSLSPGADNDLEARIAQALTSADSNLRISGVLTQQRLISDELVTDLRTLIADVKAHAKKSGRSVPVGQFLVLVSLVDKLFPAQRKAHGIPDITKLEPESATGAAVKHGNTIRANKAKRLAAAEKAAIETASVTQEHGPN